MSFSININFQSSNLSMFLSERIDERWRLVRIVASMDTENDPIVCRPMHLSVHNAYYWKVGQYQSIRGKTSFKASQSVQCLWWKVIMNWLLCSRYRTMWRNGKRSVDANVNDDANERNRKHNNNRMVPSSPSMKNWPLRCKSGPYMNQSKRISINQATWNKWIQYNKLWIQY